MTHKACKAYIRYFLQRNYSDERLAMLLAHAQSGRLVYESCCCFIGVATANHGALAGEGEMRHMNHLSDALALPGAVNAELAYRYLPGLTTGQLEADEIRRRRLIPMIRAEIWRRDQLAQQRRAEVLVVTKPVGMRGVLSGVVLGLLAWVGIFAGLRAL